SSTRSSPRSQSQSPAPRTAQAAATTATRGRPCTTERLTVSSSTAAIVTKSSPGQRPASDPGAFPPSRTHDAVATWLRYRPDMPSAEGTLTWKPLRDSLELVAPVVAAQAERVPEARVA